MMDSTVAARRSLITVQRQSIEILRSLEGAFKALNLHYIKEKLKLLQASRNKSSIQILTGMTIFQKRLCFCECIDREHVMDKFGVLQGVYTLILT